MQIALSSTFVILLSVVAQTSAIRCYICGPGAQEPFQNMKVAGGFNGNPPNTSGHYGYDQTRISTAKTPNAHTMESTVAPCEDFEEKSNFPQESIRECPPLYTGCITEIGGNRTTRTCEILDINDCKIANNITYCYCNADLCNNEKVAILTTRAWKSIDTMEDSDDEDFAESSGMDENRHHKQKNGIKPTTANGQNNIGTGRVSTPSILLHFVFCIYFCRFTYYIPDMLGALY